MQAEKTYAVFWGCQIPSRIINIEAAARRVFAHFKINLQEIDGASCCPDPVVCALLDREVWIGLAARNIALAENLGLDMMTVCNGCYETLFEANHLLREDEELRKQVNEVITPLGKKFMGNIEVKHVIEVLHNDIGIKMIKDATSNPLINLNVVLHPGCHLFRSKTPYDATKKPEMLEAIVRATGANIVPYGLEKMCCGYPNRLASEEVSLKEMLATKLEKVIETNADCIVLTCPACDLQFEYGQIELKRKYNLDYKVPVIHVLELIALSLGINHKEFGLENHRIPVSKILEKLR